MQNQQHHLTAIQASRVERARDALDAVRANRDMDVITIAGHLGNVGWYLSEMLTLVDELTGTDAS